MSTAEQPRIRTRPIRRPLRSDAGRVRARPIRTRTTDHQEMTLSQTATARERSPRAASDPLRRATLIAPIAGLVVAAALVICGLSTGVLGSLDSLREFIASLGLWGPVVFVLASIANVVFPIIPGGMLEIASPILFGPVAGPALSYVGVCTGSIANFLIARRLGVGLIERMFAPRTVEKYLGWTRGPGFARGFAIAIALPVAPDDLLCYLAGTTKMRVRTFVLIILTCKPWALIAYGLGISTLITHLLPW